MDTFSQANISPEIGTEIAHAVGISALDLQIPDIYAQYSEIAGYFKNFQDAPAVARMVARSAPLKEKLAKVYEYVGLRKELDNVRKLIKDLPMGDTITGDADDIRLKREEYTGREFRLLNEIKRYE